MAMLPDFTAFMMSSSLLIKVLPKNSMSSSPFDCFLTSPAIQSKAMAADSGTALMCAKTSFLAWACAKVGARPEARMPAMPPFTSVRRRMNRFRLLIFMIVDMARPPRRLGVLAATRPKALIYYANPIRRRRVREALRTAYRLWPVTEQGAAEAREYHTAHAVESTLPVRLRQVGGEAAAGQRIEHVERR